MKYETIKLTWYWNDYYVNTYELFCSVLVVMYNCIGFMICQLWLSVYVSEWWTSLYM